MLKFHEVIALPDSLANRWRYVVVAEQGRTCQTVQGILARLPESSDVLLLRESGESPERCGPRATTVSPPREVQWRSAFALMRAEGASAALLDRQGRVVFASRDVEPAHDLRALLAPTPEGISFGGQLMFSVNTATGCVVNPLSFGRVTCICSRSSPLPRAAPSSRPYSGIG